MSVLNASVNVNTCWCDNILLIGVSPRLTNTFVGSISLAIKILLFAVFPK